jgi:Flp pilus assembly CpaE family ATPase
MTRQLFIYWKTPAETADLAQHAAATMQRNLRTAVGGLQARLYRRSEASPMLVTLMETYAITDADLDLDQQAQIAQAAQSLAAWCPQGRHVEVFDEHVR